MTTPRWSALLLDEELTKLADKFSARMIITPKKQLVTVSLNSSIDEAKVKMGETFDQLPLIENGVLQGMLFRTRIPADADPSSIVAGYAIPTSGLESVRSSENIFEAIEHLLDNEVCVAFDTRSGTFCGLLHYADLNRQAVRIYCYLWTSALEMAMAELLESYIPNYDDWLTGLSEHRQVQVLGRHELGRRQKIELSPVEGLELSDLVHIWATHERLLEIFGISKSQFKDRVNRLVDLRNAAMHPVRSLVTKHSDVRKLADRLTDLRTFVGITANAIEARG